jgi:hypothetical protein
MAHLSDFIVQEEGTYNHTYETAGYTHTHTHILKE